MLFVSGYFYCETFTSLRKLVWPLWSEPHWSEDFLSEPHWSETRWSEVFWSEVPVRQRIFGQRNTFVRGPFGQRNPLVRGSFGQRNPLVRAPLVRGPFSSEYFNQRYPFRQRILQIKVNVLYSETKHDKSSKENIA